MVSLLSFNSSNDVVHCFGINLRAVDGGNARKLEQNGLTARESAQTRLGRLNRQLRFTLGGAG